MFPKQGVVTATYSGYKPTGKYETELRYLMEVTGARVQMESMKDQLFQSLKASAIARDPKHADRIEKGMKIVSEQDLSYDELMKLLTPIYQKNFTLEDIQELNKFYSTDAMQAMVSKLPLMTQDIVPVELVNTQEERFLKRLQEEQRLESEGKEKNQ